MWFYKKDGLEIGPIEETVMRNLYEVGNFHGTVMIKHQNWTQWKSFADAVYNDAESLSFMQKPGFFDKLKALFK